MSRRRRLSNPTTPLDAPVRRGPRDRRIAGYDVVGSLARGGTATVYLGEHPVTRQRVAIKMIEPFFAEHPEIVDRLLAERLVSERVKHPGLVDVMAADRSACGVPYLVMEYLDGENLGTLADRGPIAIDALIAIALQIADAVVALHGAGIAHCDLKPDNVLVLYRSGPDGWPQVKVIDYGVARRTDITTDETSIAGTPAYMAPEQWRGEPTPKCDVYALGCLLYELLAGDQPFHGTLPELMVAHREQVPDRVSVHRTAVPAELDRLVAQALAKDPASRPPMTEVARSLGRLAREMTAFEPLAAAG